MRPTRCPRRASSTARFAVTLDLPTPPLPLEIAMIRVSESGPNCSGRDPRSLSISARRLAGSMTPTSISTRSTPSTPCAAWRTSASMRSAAGHAAIVSSSRMRAVSPSMTAEGTMPSSVSGRRISGSITVPIARIRALGSVTQYRRPGCRPTPRVARRSRRAAFAAQRAASLWWPCRAWPCAAP